MDLKGMTMSARQLYEAKKRAMVYYQENGVPQKMEEILNSMFYDQPDDVFGHLVSYFEGFAKTPVITKLLSREVFDSRGQPSVQAEVYCMVNNKEKCLAASVASSENYEPEHASQEEKDAEEAERRIYVEKAIELLQGALMKVVVGQDPKNQLEIDTSLTKMIEELKNEEEERLAKERLENTEAEEETPRPQSVASAKKGGPKSAKGKGGKGGPAVVVVPDEPREKLFCGSNAVNSLSKAVCEAGAFVARRPIFKHIAAIKCGEVPASFVMPLPMVSIISGGRAYPGKCNCVKEYMVVPKAGMAIKESIKMLNNIFTSVLKSLTAKAGVTARLVSDSGSLCPALEKPETALDLIQEALTSLSLTPGEDVNIILDCGLQDCFDFEKGKYEVTAGMLKSGDDLIEFWADIQSRYPAIIGLIDPMRKQDKEAWMKLCERVSDQCLVIGDAAYHRPGLLKNEEIADDFKTSGIVLKCEQINTIADMLEVTKKMEGADNAVIMSANAGESPDSFLADLAVGAGARFIKIGAPCRGERVAKLNRLIQIEAELEIQGQLGPQQAHTFPHLEPPPPPPEAEGDGEGLSEKTESPTKKK